MLNDLSTYNCSLVEKIGGCAPASAFITQTSQDIINDKECRSCLILEASVNEEEYELKIFEQIGLNEILVYDSGWKHGKAERFCFRSGFAPGLFLKPATNYIAYLEVRNACSENNFRYPFKTHVTDCGNVPFEISNMRPSPATDQLYAELIVSGETERITIVAKNLQDGTNYLLKPQQNFPTGVNALNFDISTLKCGSYALMIIGTELISEFNFIKL
jgi:hypothetical protein